MFISSAWSRTWHCRTDGGTDHYVAAMSSSEVSNTAIKKPFCTDCYCTLYERFSKRHELILLWALSLSVSQRSAGYWFAVAVVADFLRRQKFNSSTLCPFPYSVLTFFSGRPRRHLPSGDQVIIRLGMGETWLLTSKIGFGNCTN